MPIFLNACFSYFAFKSTNFAEVLENVALACVWTSETFRSSAPPPSTWCLTKSAVSATLSCSSRSRSPNLLFTLSCSLLLLRSLRHMYRNRLGNIQTLFNGSALQCSAVQCSAAGVTIFHTNCWIVRLVFIDKAEMSNWYLLTKLKCPIQKSQMSIKSPKISKKCSKSNFFSSKITKNPLKSQSVLSKIPKCPIQNSKIQYIRCGYHT